MFPHVGHFRKCFSIFLGRKTTPRVDAINAVNTMASTKKEVLRMQKKCILQEIHLRKIEHNIRLKKLHAEYKATLRDIEIKNIEKKIKLAMLQKILNGNYMT